MASKTTSKTVVKTKPKPETKSEAKTTGSTGVVVAKATVARGNGTRDSIYEDAVKEIVALSENDNYSKKVDGGPLNESRGKDTWRLHTQLRAVDQLDKNLNRDVNAVRTSLAELDEHLHTDTVATTTLISNTRGDVESWINRTRGDVQNWITTSHTEVGAWLRKNHKETGDWVTSTATDTQAKVADLTKAVKDNFAKLAQATAGTEENLKSQTNAFSKAVENLLGDLRHEFDKKISEFRDEATRLIDKRFNQSDVAFAAVRADQEVIKALLTDIIKDRLGRSEPRNR